MKYINYDYGRLLNMHSLIGTFQTSSLLGKDNDSNEMVKYFISTIDTEKKNYWNDLKENPFIKDIEVKRIKQLYKSYKKMLKNSIKHKIPWYLKSIYEEIITELNRIIDDLIMKGLKFKKF